MARNSVPAGDGTMLPATERRALHDCALAECHGDDLGGGTLNDLGPLGTIVAPNITSHGLGAVYSDQELARVILHGVRRDGRTVR